MTTPAGSPGTYGPNPTPPRHAWTPIPPEPYERARCKHCPQPRHEHEGREMLAGIRRAAEETE